MMLENNVVLSFLDDVDPELDGPEDAVNMKARSGPWSFLTSRFGEINSSEKYKADQIQMPIGSAPRMRKRDRALENLARVMGMQFNAPEWVIIGQGDEGEEMYFIQTGDCIVNMRDHNK